MEGVSAWLPIISIAFSTVSGATLLIIQVRQGKDKLSADTLKKYEDALEVREITIKDLQEKLVKKEEAHALEVKGLQGQINGLQAQVDALTSKNKVLEEAVTGKVYLEKILEMLNAFQPLLAKDGILEEFKRDHAEQRADMADIKNKLNITNRHEDHGATP